MGQTYDVEFDLKVKDRQAVIEAINGYIDETDGTSIRWSLDRGDRSTLEGLMKILITDRSFFSDGDFFSSAFDASYGWEWVMQEAFEIMAPHLFDGASCTIWPDHGVDRGHVENGAVVWTD